MKIRDDIFHQKSTISNEDLNHWGKDTVVDLMLNRYVVSMKSNVKHLVTTTTVDDSATDSIIVEMEIAILNTREYRRLKEIEKQYEQLLSDGAKWR